jgi:hypothetical protein
VSEEAPETPLASRESVDATIWRIVRAMHLRCLTDGEVPPTLASANAILEPHFAQMQTDVAMLMHCVDHAAAMQLAASREVLSEHLGVDEEDVSRALEQAAPWDTKS